MWSQNFKPLCMYYCIISTKIIYPLIIFFIKNHVGLHILQLIKVHQVHNINYALRRFICIYILIAFQ